jgi:hypothetical protein
MNFNRNKIVSLALFLITVVSIILLAAFLWNAVIRTHAQGGNFLSVLFLFIALISSSISYVLYLKNTNSKLIEKTIRSRMEEEKLKIYDEINKKEEVVKEIKIDLDEIANKIIPKGNFKSIESFASKLLQNMGYENEISQGIFYISNKDFTNYSFIAGYALTNKKPVPDFKPGESLNGQVALNKEIMVINDIPKAYMDIESGLGKGKPVNLIIAPVLFENNTIAVLEFATFKSDFEPIKEIIGTVTNQIANKIVQMEKS